MPLQRFSDLPIDGKAAFKQSLFSPTPFSFVSFCHQLLKNTQKISKRFLTDKLCLNYTLIDRNVPSFDHVKYLDNLITPDDLKPNPIKVGALLKFPKPKNAQELLTLANSIVVQKIYSQFDQ